MIELIDRQAVIAIVNFECGKWRGLAKTIVKEIEELPAYPDQIRFLEFLFNVINPNEMETYISMYKSKGVAENENN